MLDITSAKNGNVQHSFRFLVHGFQPYSSNIPPGRHSESNPHSPAGQQLHAAGVHVEFADSFIVLHVCVLSALRHLYSCDLCDTVFFLIRFWTHSRREGAGACRGETPPSCLRKTALPLKSPTGAFIAAQPRHSHFRRKQKIRTVLLSRKGSDFLF